MPIDRTNTSLTRASSNQGERHSGFGMGLGKCCRCHQTVLKSGWCDTCDIWPKNMVPMRFCPDCAGPVGAAGECLNCGDFVRSRLELEGDQWRDTGKVGTRLAREKCQAIMREIDGIAERAILKAQPKVRDIEAEKRAIQAMDDVPF